MIHRFKLGMVGAALFALPGAAQAQASQEILLNSTVQQSCGMGAPTTTRIDLLDLTGPGGTLDPAKTGSAVLGSSTIADAWCNAPHKITISSTAMTLQRSVAYAQPSYMARRVTFDADLVGWYVDTSIRPHNDNDSFTINVPHAFAAGPSGLRLNISNLETLNISNTEVPELMLEHGSYLGTVTIKLAAN